MKRGAKTIYSGSKRHKSDDDSNLPYNCKPIVMLVEQLMEVEEFFRLTMTEDEDLENFLYENQKDYTSLKKISKQLKMLLPYSTSIMDDFLLAFNHMKSSHGYSMVKFLGSYPSLANYLQQVIDKIDKIYFKYLTYLKAKLEADLAYLSEESSIENSVEEQSDCFIEQKPLLTINLSKYASPKLDFDDTDYDTGSSNEKSLASNHSLSN